jgi:hypothetical protein
VSEIERYKERAATALRVGGPPAATAIAAGAVTSLVPSSPGITMGLASLSAVGAIVAGATGHWTLASHLAAGTIGLGVGTAISAARKKAQLAPWPVTRGAAVVLWGTLETRLRELAPVLERLQPQVIIVHGNDGLDADWASRVRALVPNARYWTEQWVGGVSDTGPAVRRALHAMDVLGAEAAVWNAERPMKDTGMEGRRAVQRMLGEWTASSGLPQGFTSYAQPTGHRSFPWAAFGGGRDDYGSFDLACDFSLPQVYPFGDEMRSGTAPPGTLTRLMATYESKWAEAVASGLIRPSVRCGPMIPGAHLEQGDIEAAIMPPGRLLLPNVTVWPWHGDIDAACEAAMAKFAEKSR